LHGLKDLSNNELLKIKKERKKNKARDGCYNVAHLAQPAQQHVDIHKQHCLALKSRTHPAATLKHAALPLCLHLTIEHIHPPPATISQAHNKK
jgi:hypothetical protein